MDKSAYRIIDANFNRAREALRVMEEYCRFCLNNKLLSSRAKQIRHQLCSSLNAVDRGLLLASRDSQNDLGNGLQVPGQLTRKTMIDCFTAASLRLSEALRALAEVSATVSSPLAASIEKLRFEGYSLEKDISQNCFAADLFSSVRLYVLITAEKASKKSDIIHLTKQCIKGYADCIQLRAKGMDDDCLMALADEFVDVCRGGKVISIINDRADIALLSNAHGVHLGQCDLDVARTRQLFSRPMLVGVSTHNLSQLKRAVKAGADYVGLGPAFATPTKPGIRIAGLKYLSKAADYLKETGVYHAAIGGINYENIEDVLRTGLGTVAVSSAITTASEPADMCRKLLKRVSAFLGQE